MNDDTELTTPYFRQLKKQLEHDTSRIFDMQIIDHINIRCVNLHTHIDVCKNCDHFWREQVFLGGPHLYYCKLHYVQKTSDLLFPHFGQEGGRVLSIPNNCPYFLEHIVLDGEER